jgi:hypothetical protein
MRFLLLNILLSLVFLPLAGQENDGVRRGGINAGIGFGLDYGGIGGRLAYQPLTAIGLFAGAGYNLNDIVYNFGVKSPLFTNNIMELYLTGMYGYNAVLLVSGAVTKRQTFYGFSAGGGVEWHITRRTFWNFELLIPFRNPSFKHDIDSLKDSGVDINEPLPLCLSVGYHFRF